MREMQIADLKQRRSKREREGDAALRKKKNRMNNNNDHKNNVIAQSLTHITNHIIKQTKTSKSLVEIKELCIFLVVKYSVADIDIPSRLSPSISVDNTWHWLLLFPSVYASTCQRAYELAAIITENDFAYSAFPRVVDHNPNSANDLKVVKEQRRRATLVEMTRLGLLSITAEENNETEEETEEGTEEEEEEAEGEEEDEEPLREDNASREEEEEEEQESKKGEAAFTVLNIRVKDQTGEETMFRIKNTTSFGKIMNTYASRKGVRAGDLMFFLDGERIEPYQTIADLDLEDEDQVDCFLKGSGC